MTAALVDRLRALPAADRREILARCSARQLAALRWCWREFWARPDCRTPGNVNGTGQLPPPGDWTWWAQIGGRGSGKTRSGAQWVQAEAERLGKGCVFHLVGANVDDARATMIEGHTGSSLLEVAPPWARPVFQPSVKGGTLEWPNGAVGRIFGADKPSKGRGPQCNRMWIDDPAAFGSHGKQVLDQLLFGFRVRAPDGSPPRGTVTSTPIEGELLDFFLEGEDGQRRSRIVYSRSITDDNRANLSEDFFTQTLAEFAGTELERQERYGERISGTERVFRGLDFTRPPVRVAAAPTLRRTGIGIDPSTSGGAHACEVGIEVAGIDDQAHSYLLEDLSRVASTAVWPEIVVEAAARWDVDDIVVESNKGTSWAEDLLHGAEKLRRAKLGQPMVSRLNIIAVRADETKGKRAGALVPLYRQGMIHHLPGHEETERQLVKLDGSKDQKGVDRADGAVHILNHLTGGTRTARSDGKPKAPVRGPAPAESLVVQGKSWTTF